MDKATTTARVKFRARNVQQKDMLVRRRDSYAIRDVTVAHHVIMNNIDTFAFLSFQAKQFYPRVV